MILHPALGSAIETSFGDALMAPVEQKQDALIIPLKNGVTLTVRYAAPNAYSLRWVYGDAECGIDTAPIHRGLASFPNHFHDASGRVLADPLTRIDAAPEDNLRRVVEALIADPMLGMTDIA